MERAERMRSALISRGRSPWGWRMVTLTIPHGDGMRKDARDVGRMFTAFRRTLDTYVAENLGERHSMPFLRTIEITAGKEGPWEPGDGHVHIHALFLGPYLPYPVIRMLWGRALRSRGRRVPFKPRETVLREATHDRKTGAYLGEWRERQLREALVTRRGPHGRPLAAVPWPICDVGAARNPVAELVKYIVKDWTAEGYLDPRYGAEAYEAMDGLRAVSATRGILAPDVEYEGAACESCGEVGCLDWRIQRSPNAALPPRGPPVPPTAPRMDPLAHDIYGALPGSVAVRYRLTRYGVQETHVEHAAVTYVT